MTISGWMRRALPLAVAALVAAPLAPTRAASTLAPTSVAPTSTPRSSHHTAIPRAFDRRSAGDAGGRGVHVHHVHGKQRSLVLVANFPGASSPAPTPSVSDIDAAFTQVDRFYREYSGGRVSFPTPAYGGSVQVPGVGGDCAAGFAALKKQVLAAAHVSRHTLRRFDHLVIWVGCASPTDLGKGGLGQRDVMLYNTLNPNVLAHELGHNFGLLHANLAECRSGATEVSFARRCRSVEYSDQWDIMGGGGTGGNELSAYSRSMLGWLTHRQRKNVRRSADVTVFAPGTGSHTQAAVVQGRGKKQYWIEYRPQSGLDAAAPTGGVQIRIPRGNGVDLVDTTPGTAPADDGVDGMFSPDADDAVLQPGSSVTTPEGIRITTVSANGTSAVVKVTYRSKKATAPAAPAVTGATPGAYSATVSWTRPADDGASITHYVIRASNGASATITSPGGTVTTGTIGGLPAAPVTFTVQAQNERGLSPGANVSVTAARLGAIARMDLQGVTISGGVYYYPTVELDPDKTPISKVGYYVDGNLHDTGQTVNGHPWEWTFDGHGLAPGQHHLTILTTDAKGAQRWYDAGLFNLTFPSLAITSPASGAHPACSFTVKYADTAQKPGQVYDPVWINAGTTYGVGTPTTSLSATVSLHNLPAGTTQVIRVQTYHGDYRYEATLSVVTPSTQC